MSTKKKSPTISKNAPKKPASKEGIVEEVKKVVSKKTPPTSKPKPSQKKQVFNPERVEAIQQRLNNIQNLEEATEKVAHDDAVQEKNETSILCSDLLPGTVVVPQRKLNNENEKKTSAKVVTSPKTEMKTETKITLDESLHQYLLKKHIGTHSIESLADHFDCGPSKIREAISRLNDKGVNVEIGAGEIEIQREIPPERTFTKIDTRAFRGNIIKCGLTADNHLGSKYARLDVLNALFDIWEEQGIRIVYQCGNMIDGDASFNKHDLLVHGMQAQIDYFIENWPQRDGITTQFITGDDHEGWYTQREGVNIGKMIATQAREQGREDLVYLGHMEHDIQLNSKKGNISFLRLIHAGGGSAYATSYSVQKIVESYQGGEKPAVLFVGHYHKAEYGYPREVHVVQAGCTEDQTPFMRKKKLQAHVGGWTISFELDDRGLIHGFTPRFDPFYDRGFYRNDKQWKYHFNSPPSATARFRKIGKK